MGEDKTVPYRTINHIHSPESLLLLLLLNYSRRLKLSVGVHSHLARVEINELVQRLGLWVGVFQHPKQVFEEHNLASDVDRVIVTGVAGTLDKFPENRVVDDVGAQEVATPRLADVDRVEVRPRN